MKQEFAVYAYRNVAYEEQVFKVSGNLDSIEEALHFKFFVE